MSLSPTYTRTSPRTAPNVFPTSLYLQERLEERRSRHQRPRRSRQSDAGPQPARNDDIFVQEGDSTSSQHGTLSTHRRVKDYTRSAETTPARATSTGGMRHLNEQLDRLTKLNFDLKLELDHRRAHQVKLNAEIEQMRAVAERAEHLAAEHAELLKINGQLVEELEKRDKGMQEAVEIICDLEERLFELEDDRRSVTRASTVHADSGYAGTETLDASSFSPDKQRHHKRPSKVKVPSVASRKLNDAINASTVKPRKEPSFMIQEDANTRNLRSVYRESTMQLRPVKSFHSILSRHTSTIDDDENAQADIMNSPRLSDLSESSFPNIFRARKTTLERNAWEPAESPSPPPLSAPPIVGTGLHSRQDSISRVSQWIEGHDVSMSQEASSVRTLSPPTPAALDHFYQSLHNTTSDHKVVDSAPHQTPFRPHTAHDISRTSSKTPTSFGGPIFGEPIMSQSNDTRSSILLRASRSTIIDEKSVVDAPTSQLRSAQAFDSGLRTTPRQMRSSLELKNAFASNLEHRKVSLSQIRHAVDATSSVGRESPDMHIMHNGWLGCPDGGSILLGTPSRFFNQDPTTKISARNDRNQPVPRRKSSSAVTADARKPDLVRAGTSPHMPPTLITAGNRGRPKTPLYTDARSPRAHFSSDRAALPTESRSNAHPLQEPRSPPRRGMDHVPPSPVRTLSQKTHSILRRLSGSHGSDRDPQQQISPSPSRPILPSLTSTPSSAYVNVIPKDLRRANGDAASRTIQSTSIVQSPIHARARADSEVRGDVVEKRGLFGRRGSFKQATGIDRSKTATPSGRGRRRSSVREVITQGIRW